MEYTQRGRLCPQRLAYRPQRGHCSPKGIVTLLQAALHCRQVEVHPKSEDFTPESFPMGRKRVLYTQIGDCHNGFPIKHEVWIIP